MKKKRKLALDIVEGRPVTLGLVVFRADEKAVILAGLGWKPIRCPICKKRLEHGHSEKMS